MNTPEFITTSYWLSLPKEARKKIVEKLKIKPSCGIVTYNRDGITTVQCDGFSQEDLNLITKERMEEAIGDKGDFWKLFGSLVNELFDDIEKIPDKFVCDCGMVAKNIAGLKSHKRNCVYKVPNKADNHQKDEKIHSEGKSPVGSDGNNLQNGD